MARHKAGVCALTLLEARSPSRSGLPDVRLRHRGRWRDRARVDKALGKFVAGMQTLARSFKMDEE